MAVSTTTHDCRRPPGWHEAVTLALSPEKYSVNRYGSTNLDSAALRVMQMAAVQALDGGVIQHAVTELAAQGVAYRRVHSGLMARNENISGRLGLSGGIDHWSGLVSIIQSNCGHPMNGYSSSRSMIKPASTKAFTMSLKG